MSKRNLSADPHKWWKIAKKSRGLEASETIPQMSVNGRACLTDSDKAESLNTVFAQQCSGPAAESTCSKALPELENRFRCKRFTFTALPTKDVFGRQSKLNVRKAPGDDGVNHQILKSCAHALAEPLCHIFNVSLKTGVFPRQWKTAWIQPIQELGWMERPPKLQTHCALTMSRKFLSTSYISSCWLTPWRQASSPMSNLVSCHHALLYGGCFPFWRRYIVPWMRAAGHMRVSLTFQNLLLIEWTSVEKIIRDRGERRRAPLVSKLLEWSMHLYLRGWCPV